MSRGLAATGATAVLLAIVTVVAVVTQGPDGASNCSPREEAREPGAIHVLPGTDIVFELSPPTSGPHMIPAPDPGVAIDPIVEARQVSALESGYVLIQYQPGLDAAAVDQLVSLASDQVIVAPAARAFDEGANVAFTAWGIRQLCSAVDIAVARSFINDRAGIFFTNHGTE